MTDAIAKMVSRLTVALLSAAGIAHVLTGPAAASTITGVWIDHTKRGAVEIYDCGGKVCGKVYWVKDKTDMFACGNQIIGNAKPLGPTKWGGGWIYDPEERSKYAVEITMVGNDRLKIVGSAAMGLISETYFWTRASAPLQPCKV